MLARSVVAVGVCANATDANNADPIRPAVIYFASMGYLPEMKLVGRKPADPSVVPITEHDLSVSRADHRRVRCNIAPHMRTANACNIAAMPTLQSRSETAPIRRRSVIAVQFGFLRTIAPVEIQVGAGNRIAPLLRNAALLGRFLIAIEGWA